MLQIRPAAAALAALLAAIPGTAGAQKMLRIGMTAADIPTTTGMPNNGFEGMRFLGYTAFEALVLWDLSQTARRPAFKPGLATSLGVDDADKTKPGSSTLRRGVNFHDGTPLDADAVPGIANASLTTKARSSSPTVPRASAAPASPILSGWREDRRLHGRDHHASAAHYFPFMVVSHLIACRQSWESAGNDWAEVAELPAAGTGPFRLSSFTPRESIAELLKNADYWDSTASRTSTASMLCRCRRRTTRLAALRGGQVDWIEVPPPDAIPSLTRPASRSPRAATRMSGPGSCRWVARDAARR